MVRSGFGVAGTLLTSWAEMWTWSAGSDVDVEVEHSVRVQDLIVLLRDGKVVFIPPPLGTGLKAGLGSAGLF